MAEDGSHTDRIPDDMTGAPDTTAQEPASPDLPSPNKGTIPLLLPPHLRLRPDDSSIVETTRLEHDEKHLDSLAEEREVRAHLEDVESSFIPPISPIQVAGPEAGADDTYLFDATTNKPPASILVSPPSDPVSGPEPEPVLKPEPSQPQRDAYRDPSTEPATESNPVENPASLHPATSMLGPSLRDDFQNTVTRAENREPTLPEPLPDDPDVTESGNSTSALDSLSSPTAAAAARAVSRAMPVASKHAGESSASAEGDLDAPPRDSSSLDAPTEETVEALNLDHQNSDQSLHAPENSLGLGKRPKYLRSRNASQRSSTSSFLSNEDVESDVTVGLGADYALQTGGAMPTLGLTRSASNTLSRSVSIGSMASGFDEAPDPIRPDPLEPLEEVESPAPKHRADPLATPKAKRGSLTAPTDTVIARHVRNVEVPESLANEYKTKGGLSTPVHQPYRKPSNFTPATTSTAARSGKNLTLKEQSSTIERLSKENFDLKLKVMFLSDRLDKLSEEGVKEMISENVELRTSLAVTQRDNKILRRRVKELEKRLRDEEDRPSTARSGYSSDGAATPAFDPDAQEREEELLYLRERVEEYVAEIERLRSENMSNQAEKRRLAETVKTMGDRAGERAGDGLGRQEEADVYKDLLEQETARREQADDENRKLRDEIFRLRQEMNGSASGGGGGGGGGGGMHHTTNIYNITRKSRPMSPSRSRPVSGLSGEIDPSSSSQSATLVEELRRESEQLRHENAELRREVGAQTSMLTSRNREKERLYQEIEDLKLAQRRGGPAPSTIDSILDRSASRAGGHERSTSRGSGRTRLTMTVEEDPDREELENKLAEHRDKVNELKFEKQELQRELQICMEELDHKTEAKKQVDEHNAALEEELQNTVNDLMQIQAERDEALQEQAHLEAEFDILRKEAQEEIDSLESESDQKGDEIQRLQIELQDRTENFDALQEEMRQMSEALVRLEDEQEKKLKRIEQLEQELSESNKELEDLEVKLLEANDKSQRLGVQQESSQGEIAFLREEQEADKIRIGDLEAALASTEQSLREERDRTKELEQRLANERKQSEIVATREKEEVQQFVNELNREVSTAKDEARRLRKSLTSREVEATEWKERLMELENNLREALGDLNGTRSSLLKSIAKLQRELENTVRELDTTKNSMLEKDRIIKQRDALLESHGLESRRLAEMLDKERQAHRNTKNQFETFQRTHQHVSRTVTSQDSRILELEASRATDKKKIAQLETSFKEQLNERNNLLLILWTRLSSLCGSDWAHDNSLINGRALPSLESVSTMLPGFAKNLLGAVKTIESLVGSFQSRIKAVERELWKEYQSLENSLDAKGKKLERLETIVRTGIAAGNFDAQAKVTQLETAYRALKIENATLQRANDARTRGAGWSGSKKLSSNGSHEDLIDGGSPSPSVPTGPHRRDSKLPRSKTTHLDTGTSGTKSRSGSISRSASTMGVAEAERLGTSNGEGSSGKSGDDNRWMFRLRELEYKLKQEREARHMDRVAARQRIQDSERQNSELTAELVRVKRRGNGE
ncbi:hypothetical protein GGS23DRAFT_263203 [Durotheca rogersii]|uniref:uncharacterized protein n=1 Tax=Durotheca rogersii TaxID=419775 RepID=UPI00221E6721|nr:uncharacterized protein GGS23DRAFT_263203 [Durotheca rogersii]KAI5859832.1 hypothetical protein GGS23DRAFT_263203 [Durotheca rogersii]